MRVADDARLAPHSHKRAKQKSGGIDRPVKAICPPDTEEDPMHFRIRGLPAEQFAPLFALTDAELAERGAVRRIADGREPGYPCRVSLSDSRPGDELILLNYEHLPADSPYRMRFAIFVRKGDATFDAVDTVPEQ